MNSGFTFTFRRDGFKPCDYRTATQDDCLDVVYFHNCWSLAAKLEKFVRENCLATAENCYAIDSIAVLKELYFVLLEEKYLAMGAQFNEMAEYNGIRSAYDADTYLGIIKENLHNLEWLLYYWEGRIAASQFFEHLSENCFYNPNAGKQMWISMCEAWGNSKPDAFALVFWIE